MPSIMVPSPVFHRNATEPQRRPHEQKVVEPIEVPGVEQELVGAAEALGEAEGHERIGDVEIPGDAEAERHGDGGRQPHQQRHLVMLPRMRDDRPSPERGLIGADEIRHEDAAGEQRTEREHDQRQTHGPRRLMRVRQHLRLLARLSFENEEHQPPGVERGERRGDERQHEAVSADDGVRRIGGLDHRILGDEAGREGEACQRQSADQHHRPGEGQHFPQAAHPAHVLLVM